MIWAKEQTDQQDRMQILETGPDKYSQMIFDNKKKRQFNRKEVVNSRNGARTTGYPHAKELI